MSPTVAVIGAGNIGSRHLEALGRMPVQLELYVVDPSPESRAVARRRCGEVARLVCAHKVSYLAGLEELPEVVDVAIVATTARVRGTVTTALLTTRQVGHLVLEKVLFQRLAEYEAVGRLIAELGVPTWVNLPRRLYPAYRSLPETFAAASWIDYRVSGSNWGLGCNGIHFIDQLALIAGQTDVELDARGLDPGTIPSRRTGFKEFTGRLIGRCGTRATISLTSLARGALPVQISIDSDVARFVIGENEGVIRQWKATADTEWAFEASTAELPPQSRLSHLVVADLLEHGRCGLPRYDHAAALHAVFVDALLDHLRAGGDEMEECPIT